MIYIFVHVQEKCLNVKLTTKLGLCDSRNWCYICGLKSVKGRTKPLGGGDYDE